VLEAYIRQKREQSEILLMTHIVLGYPNFDQSLRLVEAMVESGVELMELQIPFSEPIADGPVILRANQLALSAGSTVARCFEFASEVAKRFPIPFLFMSYYNVLFKHGTSLARSDFHLLPEHQARASGVACGLLQRLRVLRRAQGRHRNTHRVLGRSDGVPGAGACRDGAAPRRRLWRARKDGRGFPTRQGRHRRGRE
jgi:hypothetical protein